MAKQKFIDAVRGKRTETAPWVPYAGVHCAFLINEPADKYLQDPALLAKGLVETAKKYKADGIPLVFDLSIEAHSLGCELKWWQDNVPSVTSHPCSDKTPAEAGLQMPTKDSGRWPILFEAARIAKPQLDELDCAMIGGITGPLTLASHLAGVRIFTDVIKNPAFAAEVCEFAGKVGAIASQFYIDMGCDVIAIIDPVASQIRSKTFQEYVSPNVKDAIKVINDAGLHFRLFYLRRRHQGNEGCL